MQDPLDALEARIDQLRRAVRTARAAGDLEQIAVLQEELRRTQRAWDALVGPPETASDELGALGSAAAAAWSVQRAGAAPMLPAREQVHRVLMLLGVPAAPKLIVEVHAAFFPDALPATRLASLRRDEERSYRSAPNARPYYLCPALTYDMLSAARALITISTWPLERRVVGPLSPRVDYLTAAIRVAEAAQASAERPELRETGAAHAAQRLVLRFAQNIPGASLPSAKGPATPRELDPRLVAAAARAELDLHAAADQATRAQSATRARSQLSDEQQLFGARLTALGAQAADG